jgi:hypothetical protein
VSVFASAPSQWEVAHATERVVTLFGREAANSGRKVRPLRGLEPIARMAVLRVRRNHMAIGAGLDD